jgi:hypothetical protein
VIDKDKEKQWDQEMAQVDRLLAKLPTYQPTKPHHGGDPTLKRSSGGQVTGVRGGTGAGMWIKVGLGLVLAAGVTAWPYSHVCGINLFSYFAAAGTVVIAGMWAGLASWRRRAGFAHVLALGVVMWGLGLVATVVLPRVGGRGQAGAIWFCPEPPTQLAPTRR